MSMKNLRSRIPHLVTAVLLLLGLMTAATSQAQATPQRITGNATICSNSPVPAGWVITSSYSTGSCTGTSYLYTISDASTLTNATVCSYSPVPAGWVISGSYNTGSCADSGFGYYIRKV
nr:hypothetical protein KPHV_48390 [Kitasatospora purpeofusca]